MAKLSNKDKQIIKDGSLNEQAALLIGHFDSDQGDWILAALRYQKRLREKDKFKIYQTKSKSERGANV